MEPATSRIFAKKPKNLEKEIFRGLKKKLGALSNDNRDGDGNATGSGKTQKVHCA